MIQLSFTMLTLGVVSALAMILGAVGLNGVLAYVVAARPQEIGVRMALGATAASVRRMVVVQGAKVVLVGVVVGLAVAADQLRAHATREQRQCDRVNASRLVVVFEVRYKSLRHSRELRRLSRSTRSETVYELISKRQLPHQDLKLLPVKLALGV